MLQTNFCATSEQLALQRALRLLLVEAAVAPEGQITAAQRAAVPPVTWLDRIETMIDATVQAGDTQPHVVTDNQVRDALIRIGAIATLGIAAIERAQGVGHV